METGFQITNIAMAHSNNDDLKQVKALTSLVSHHMVYFMLKEDSIRLNGYVSGNGHTTHMRSQLTKDKGFKDAISTLETCCKDLKAKHQREIEDRVKTLDISNSMLYMEYRESCSRLMDDDIRWGRITVLLFFTSVLAKRLYTENKAAMIESLVGWQTTFLNEITSQWILDHGGWVRDCNVFMCVVCVKIVCVGFV